MNRTHNNGELRIENVNAIVELKGWVSKSRNLGGLIFIDLRDRYGITQIVVNPENPNYEKANELKNEFVVYIKGIVVERQSKNNKIPTGEIEILASEIEIIKLPGWLCSAASTPNFSRKSMTFTICEPCLKMPGCEGSLPAI